MSSETNQIPENVLSSFIELRNIVHHAFYHDGKVSGDVLNALRRANTVLKKLKTDDSSASFEDYFVNYRRPEGVAASCFDVL